MTPPLLDDLFAAALDVLLESQFHPTRGDTPEQKLMWAILEDVLHDLQMGRNARATVRGQRLFEETLDWITADDARYVFSFVHICQALGLDPDYIRRGLQQLASQQEQDAPHVTSTK